MKFLRDILFCLSLLLMIGCDNVYKYIVFPPERIEYTLVPDADLLLSQNDRNYRLSDDRQSIIYDAKDYKIEVKYLTDYHLNTYEFPDQSQSQQFSTNPFTFGNWIDPELGYTPNRFTVFKVTIYNYAGGKVNLDPENIFLKTDRGDELNSFGREEKNSRYQSLEAYFKKRKGTSGIDDDVFESRMGIVRRSVHYLGKPVFRGDVRDGLIVMNPLADEVEQLKVTIKDFILGYDENNQPSEFTTLKFYFRRARFELPKNASIIIAERDSLKNKNAIKQLEPSARPMGELKIAVKSTNVISVDQLMKPLDQYLSEFTNFKTLFVKTAITAADLQASNILMILADEGQMKFSPEQERLTADFIKRGGFIIADERSSSTQSENYQSVNNFLTEVSNLLGGNVTTGRVPTDHPIYNVWKRFDILPPVDPDLQDIKGQELNDFLTGIFHNNRLVAVVSNRGYSIAWGVFGTSEIRSGKDFTKQREFLSNIFYYAIASANHEK